MEMIYLSSFVIIGLFASFVGITMLINKAINCKDKEKNEKKVESKLSKLIFYH